MKVYVLTSDGDIQSTYGTLNRAQEGAEARWKETAEILNKNKNWSWSGDLKWESEDGDGDYSLEYYNKGEISPAGYSFVKYQGWYSTGLVVVEAELVSELIS